MAKPLRPKRGTTAKNDAFTGLASEITIDTDKHSIRVHDGVTAGGHEILPKAKNDELYAPQGDYLPKSGGEVSGDIAFGGEGVVGGVDEPNFKYVKLKGSGENAGEFEAFSSDSPYRSGWFVCRARGPNGELYDLYGMQDGKLTWIGNEVLTSAGGTLTESFTLSGESWLAKQADASADTVVLGGTKPDDGAYFQATGKDSWGGGEFWVVANDGTHKTELRGRPDGTLIWGDKTVARLSLPNYSAGVSYPWDSDNKAPKDGWVLMSGGVVADRVNSMELWIDGVRVAFNRVEWNVTNSISFMIPVRSGSYFHALGTQSNASLTFYPCVGA